MRAAGLELLLLIKIVLYLNNVSIVLAVSKIKEISGTLLIHTFVIGFLPSPYLPSPPTLILWLPLLLCLAPPVALTSKFAAGSFYLSNTQVRLHLLAAGGFRVLCLCCSGPSSFSPLLIHISVALRLPATRSPGTQSCGMVYKIWQSSASQLSRGSQHDQIVYPSFFLPELKQKSSNLSMFWKKKGKTAINWLDNFLSVRLKKHGCLLNFKFLLQIWVNASGGGEKKEKVQRSDMEEAVRNTNVGNEIMVTNQECQ